MKHLRTIKHISVLTGLLTLVVGQTLFAVEVDDYGIFNPRNIEKRTSPFLPPTGRSAPITTPSTITPAQKKSVRVMIAEFLIPSAYWEGEQQRVFISSQFYQFGDIIKLEVRENPEMYEKPSVEVILISLAEDMIEFKETTGSDVMPVNYRLDPDLESRDPSGIGPAKITYVGRGDNFAESFTGSETNPNARPPASPTDAVINTRPTDLVDRVTEGQDNESATSSDDREPVDLDSFLNEL